ncbi:MAG: hypothetical protein U9Q99_00380 [Nanoarchaeota archaeon]|nr:hypothetical protein [Nanoarchaeota archaeon]
MKNKLIYILKNSWDILPGVNEFQLFKNVKRTGNNLYSNSNEKIPSALKIKNFRVYYNYCVILII